MPTTTLATEDPYLQETCGHGSTSSRTQEPFNLRSFVQLCDLTEDPIVPAGPAPSFSASSSSSHHGMEGILNDRMDHDYLPLYKAALKGDWEWARALFDVDPEAMTAPITYSSQTALHVAAAAGQSRFVEELVELLPPEALELREAFHGETALHQAAVAGMTRAAKAMVNKNRNLTQIGNYSNGWVPLLLAANFASSSEHKEMVEYLSIVTRDDDPNPFSGHFGASLICGITNAGFYDIALSLIQRYPNLATEREDDDGTCALQVLARRAPHAFLSGNKLRSWQRLIYSFIPVDVATVRNHATVGDMEDPPQNMGEPLVRCSSRAMTKFLQVFQWMNELLWERLKQTVPGVRQVYEKKLTHNQALALVKCICAEVSAMNNSAILNFFIKPDIWTAAATSGIIEIVVECFQTYPDLIWFSSDHQTVLGIAIEQRRENIFNLICGMSAHRKLAAMRDESRNTILHLAAILPPSPQLNSISGAALQMQRELQWFKEVEKIALPSSKVKINYDGKTAQILFTEQHKDLMEKGEKWIKDTAQSCMLVATLIATVVFAAAFTVPGGNFNDDNTLNKAGMPIFIHKNSFMVFVVADALALFSSTSSILMFLSILTSRYAEEDFLEALPKRLIIGLATLFFSIATMLIAFSATLHIVFAQKLAWVPVPIGLIACVPVTLFAMLQFPLFVEMVRSTYGPTIFCGQNIQSTL